MTRSMPMCMFALLLASFSFAEETAAKPASEPDVILADAVVSTKGKKHVVSDLQREDFAVTEDGETVEIVSFEAFPTHYEIRFHPLAGKSEDKWRKLRVTVKREGLTVRSRAGYRLHDERTRPKK
jgi:hypothetical protein